MGLGSAGATIIFVFVLALLAIVGAIVLAICARYLFSVIQQSAAGNDVVEQADEPFLDWAFQGVYLLFLLGIWMAPLGIILRSISRDIFLEETILATCVAGIVLWLFFPIGALSSMSSLTRWAVFRWTIFRQLFRNGSQIEFFYPLSLVIFILGLGPWLLVIVTGHILLMCIASLCSSAAILMYARLLGRWAWILSGIRPKRKPGQGPRKRRPKRERIPTPQVEEEVPEILESSEQPRSTGIMAGTNRSRPTRVQEEVVEDEPAPMLLIVEEDEPVSVPEPPDENDLQLVPIDEPVPHLEIETQEEDVNPYDLSSKGVAPNPAVDVGPIEEIEEILEADEPEPEAKGLEPHERIVKREKPKRRAPRSLVRGVFEFPFYENSLSMWAVLAFGLFLFSLVILWMLSLSPVQ